MYSREDFIERFRGMETALLVHRLTTGELTDVARDALCHVLHERGVPLEPISEVRLAIPEREIAQHALEIKCGACPICHQSRSGVEVRESYWVWSALVITRRETRRVLCCRTCGTHDNWAAVGFNLALGWWGVPNGILLTPYQIIRNLLVLCRRREESQPSKALLELVKSNLLAQRQLEIERMAI
jgi:hypothetical protein